MKYEIESNIPVPDIQKKSILVSDIAEAMTSLAIGQSFLVPVGGPNDRIGRLQSAFAEAKSKFEVKLFISRKQINEDGSLKGIRIWRLE